MLKVMEQMPETKSKRPATAKKPVARKASPAAARKGKGGVQRTTELSEDVFRSLDESARSALDAVREFTETVDRALPPHGEGPSRAQEITDSALAMAQRLVHTQAEFLRKVVDSAGRSLEAPPKAK